MDFLYRILQIVGYNHPLHPPLTHMPIGLVVAAFIFLLLACGLKHKSDLTKAAHYCILLALIFLIPAAFTGFTDWLHYYAGAWIYPIKVKVGLTCALFIFLMIGVFMENKNLGGLMIKSVIYLFCVICVTGLGYFGGDLVFAGKAAVTQEESQGGKELYIHNCGGCHPKGGNVISPDLPVINSSKLKTLDDFKSFNRNPKKTDGSPGIMPAFSKEKLSDQQLKEIYQYITVFLTKKRS